MTAIKQIDKFIEAAKDECAEKIIQHLTPLIRAEFERVRAKHNPRLKAILWGNGGYCFVFQPESGQDGNWWEANKQYVPKYAHKLIEMVCIASDETGGLHEDVYADDYDPDFKS